MWHREPLCRHQQIGREGPGEQTRQEAEGRAGDQAEQNVKNRAAGWIEEGDQSGGIQGGHRANLWLVPTALD